MENGFEGLNKKLNADFDGTLDDVENALDSFNNKKTVMVEKSKNGTYTLEDEEYLRFELKTLIQGSRVIMDKLEKDIKIGSQPRVYEVYSALLKTTIDGLKELRELNKTVTDLEIESDKPKVSAGDGKTINNTTNNVILTGKDLLTMIRSAKEENQLNTIEARFELGDHNNL
jgi:Xaa-Pro aminopeptidase